MLLDPREVRPEGFPDPAASGNSVSSLWRKDWRALLCTIPSPGYCTPNFFILFIHIHCIFYHELSDSLIFMWLPWCVKSKKNVPAFSSAEDAVLWDRIAPPSAGIWLGFVNRFGKAPFNRFLIYL